MKDYFSITDDIFKTSDDIFRGFTTTSTHGTYVYALYKTREDESMMVAQMAIPGISKENILIQTSSNNSITISSNLSEGEENGIIENFEKTYAIDSKYDITPSKVTLKNGLLTLNFKPNNKVNTVKID